MARIEPKILRGFRDYLPDVMISRRRMILAVCEVFERFGFSPLDTPALEYTEILLGKYGGEAEKLLYRFKDNGDRDVCMRYDLTVPLARVAAMYRNLPKPFKRYQVGNVWRAENPGRGRFREFTQCDVDIVGSASLAADAECLAVDYFVMKELGANATIHINNRKVFRGLQELLGVEENSAMNAILRVVDKLPKVGEEGVRAELEGEVGLSPALADRVLTFCRIGGGPMEVLAELDELLGATQMGKRGIAELREVLELAWAMGVPKDGVKLDPSIARGLDYYTGTVFETFLNDLQGYGSVMSGGRYDDLIGVYAGEQIPAVGISVGLDRLLAGLIELGKLEQRPCVSEALVTVFAPEQRAYSCMIAAKLREAGVRAELFLEDSAKFKRQLKHADALAVPFVVIAGPDEQAKGTATLRDMTGGEQQELKVDDLVRELANRLTHTRLMGKNAQTWNWPFNEASILNVADVRGLYILRDEARNVVDVNYSATGLRQALRDVFARQGEDGEVRSFDWYEAGDEAIGKELATFLKSRLLD